LIRWGYYQRQGQPLLKAIRIQRVRCKCCGRTTNVLPSFLLAQKSYAVSALEQLVITYLQHPHDWKQALNIMIDLSTAYRWLRIFVHQANTTLPDIRKVLLKLKPDYQLTEHINGKPAPMANNRIILHRFIAVVEQLCQTAVRLIDNNQSTVSQSFCFLNHFLATQTKNALLQA
jgi:hypothetical protein